MSEGSGGFDVQACAAALSEEVRLAWTTVVIRVAASETL